MAERIEEITEKLIEERKTGVKVEAIGPVMLSGALSKSEKIMPQGAVFYLTKDEYNKLSKNQRPKIVTDTKTIKGEDAKKSQDDMIRFLKSQPGGKRMIEALKKKAGPVVRKTNKKESSREDLKKLRLAQVKRWAQEEEEAKEQVEASNG